MDGLDLGSRKIKVSIAKISSLIKHQEKLEKEAKKAGPPSIQVHSFWLQCYDPWTVISITFISIISINLMSVSLKS